MTFGALSDPNMGIRAQAAHINILVLSPGAYHIHLSIFHRWKATGKGQRVHSISGGKLIVYDLVERVLAFGCSYGYSHLPAELLAACMKLADRRWPITIPFLGIL